MIKIAAELASELRRGDRILLEGPMGAGKSTFARALIEKLGVSQETAGSPTFAIAHEYRANSLEIIHLDFYRIRSETEIEEAGIPSYFWGREAIVIAEWVSLFPEFEEQLLRSSNPLTGVDQRNWRIRLDFCANADGFESARQLEIKQLF